MLPLWVQSFGCAVQVTVPLSVAEGVFGAIYTLPVDLTNSLIKHHKPISLSIVSKDYKLTLFASKKQANRSFSASQMDAISVLSKR